MRYKSFRIQNFKGIKDTTVKLDSVAGASVFAFVGLNESGKTTVLEAIHSYSPEAATGELLGGKEGIGVPFKARVPRHQLSSFTGDVSVTAVLELNSEDKAKIAKELLENNSLILNTETMPSEITMEKQQRFENGDFKKSFFTLRTEILVKKGKARTWRLLDIGSDEGIIVRDAIHELSPEIAYFPTLVFNFPDRVFLSDRGGSVDRFYRKMFQDILDYDGRGHTIEKDIVGRVRATELTTSWIAFWSAWGSHDSRAKIQQVMDRVSAAMTRLVFGRWDQIFHDDAGNKEVVVSSEVVEGELSDGKGTITKTEQHDVYVTFQIRDGTRRFKVNDRSLGFRWFFAFMLFTQFRVARSRSRKLLFLFDEPASNLHAAAQQKLIESFPEIARDDHMLAYTTHSHYMIEPKWLEQTFIVTNRSDTPNRSVLSDLSLDDESLDIKVATYRSFVNDHPQQISYFQPILDRLQVVPSRFDLQIASIIVEGRSDYYILRYGLRLHNLSELPILPGLGAGTFNALAALHVGWNLNFLFVLDGDKQGLKERQRYSSEFGIPLNRLVTLDELGVGRKEIEDFCDTEAKDQIQKTMGLASHPTKAQIKRFFQEKVASDQIENLGNGFADGILKVLKSLKSRLQ